METLIFFIVGTILGFIGAWVTQDLRYEERIRKLFKKDLDQKKKELTEKETN
jgi:hypothetical protein